MSNPPSDAMLECGTCKFFSADDDQSTVPQGQRTGTCHRYPPTDHPFVGDEGEPTMMPVFPVVLDSEWCGEHRRAVVPVIDSGDVLDHEPHVPCTTCGHEMGMHRAMAGACMSFNGCRCTGFEP